jgi:hypothetical protein
VTYARYLTLRVRTKQIDRVAQKGADSTRWGRSLETPEIRFCGRGTRPDETYVKPGIDRRLDVIRSGRDKTVTRFTVILSYSRVYKKHLVTRYS